MKQNYEDYKEYFKKHYQKNKAKRKASSQKSVANRKDEVREYHRIWKQNKRSNDPHFRIKDSVQSQINQAVRYYNLEKKSLTVEELGCSIQEYFIYLESQFDDKMSGDNYGLYWEIDHIQPLSKGGSFHYTNTQPLTINENRVKGNRTENETTQK